MIRFVRRILLDPYRMFNDVDRIERYKRVSELISPLSIILLTLFTDCV